MHNKGMQELTYATNTMLHFSSNTDDSFILLIKKKLLVSYLFLLIYTANKASEHIGSQQVSGNNENNHQHTFLVICRYSRINWLSMLSSLVLVPVETSMVQAGSKIVLCYMEVCIVLIIGHVEAWLMAPYFIILCWL